MYFVFMSVFAAKHFDDRACANFALVQMIIRGVCISHQCTVHLDDDVIPAETDGGWRGRCDACHQSAVSNRQACRIGIVILMCGDTKAK